MKILLKRLSLVLAILSLAVAVHAAETSPQVWLLSTRQAAHCGQLDDPAAAIRYWRMADDGSWTPAAAKDFHAGEDIKTPTVVFVHGNRTDADEAVEKGWYTYQSICAEADGRPFRYVIWSWPADRMFRHSRPDVQLKAEYCDAESYYLAAWLHGVRPDTKLSLVGHSFGPRIITGALHLLAGGELAGRTLATDTNRTATKPMRIRAVL